MLRFDVEFYISWLSFYVEVEAAVEVEFEVEFEFGQNRLKRFSGVSCAGYVFLAPDHMSRDVFVGSPSRMALVENDALASTRSEFQDFAIFTKMALCKNCVLASTGSEFPYSRLGSI